jgi:hypothetical protein
MVQVEQSNEWDSLLCSETLINHQNNFLYVLSSNSLREVKEKVPVGVGY